MKSWDIYCRNIVIGIIGLGFTFGLLGCSQGMKVEYVEGKVSYQGKSVEGASVVFTPKSDSSVALTAFGKTDNYGVFKLTAQENITKGEGRGTTEGDYIVTISKMVGGYDENLVGKSPEEVSKLDRMRNEGKYSPKMVPYENQLPERYKNPETSNLSVTIKKGKNLGVDFDLTD